MNPYLFQNNVLTAVRKRFRSPVSLRTNGGSSTHFNLMKPFIQFEDLIKGVMTS